MTFWLQKILQRLVLACKFLKSFPDISKISVKFTFNMDCLENFPCFIETYGYFSGTFAWFSNLIVFEALLGNYFFSKVAWRKTPMKIESIYAIETNSIMPSRTSPLIHIYVQMNDHQDGWLPGFAAMVKHDDHGNNMAWSWWFILAMVRSCQDHSMAGMFF